MHIQWIFRWGPLLAGFLCAGFAVPASAEVESEICVYGGNAGGVMAAVQAARQGRTVVLIEPGRHLGGLTTGGLGWTDTGSAGAIGGLAAAFYRRIGAHYGQAGARYTFEPHVAEGILNDFIREHRIPVFFEHRLSAVQQSGGRLTGIETENGAVFRAGMFIDCTYEGDLMSAAGVDYTVGREGNSPYGETINGIQWNTSGHQFLANVDPYRVPGNPASGLLPLVQADNSGTSGDGDTRVQAYNFRLCLTQVATNRVPIVAPAGYDPAEYELLGRYIEARVAAGHGLSLRSFLKIDPMPNGKTDINNNGAVSTDFIGQNYEYPEADAATRGQIRDRTLAYIQGLLHFLGTDARVPAGVRNEMNSWGTCRDEFQDTGGWPHQMYVREARRMVSPYVMTEHNARGTVRAPKSVGLASYTMDSHNCRRTVRAGVVRNEGDVQERIPGPYPIAYDSMVPDRSQCENLFVPVCLSASHIAYGSIRMEPVFMVTGQSAASAACLALDDGLAVQDVEYGKLSLQLLADGQILQWGHSGYGDPDELPPGSVLVDSEDAAGVVLVGEWLPSTSVGGYHGVNYLHDGNSGQGSKSVRLVPDLPSAGSYEVFLRWTEHVNRAANAPVRIGYEGGAAYTTVDQTTGGGQWVSLGVYPYLAGAGPGLTLDTTNANGYVVADAALWVPAGVEQKPRVEGYASDALAGEEGPDSGTVTFFRSGSTLNPLTVAYTLSGTAVPGEDIADLPGTVVIPAGAFTAPVHIYPLADDEAEGDQTAVVTLSPDPAYTPGPLTRAVVTVRDRAFDGWRFLHFSPAQLADPAVSGAEADSEGDRFPNLLEFQYGLDPWQVDTGGGLGIDRASGDLQLTSLRHREAAGMRESLETSTNLVDWVPASPVGPVEHFGLPYDRLAYGVAAAAGPETRRYWRTAHQVPPSASSGTAYAYFSFDTLENGTGSVSLSVSAQSGLSAVPVLDRTGSVLSVSGDGGAAHYVAPDGRVWLGSGSSQYPGHSCNWNPGGTNQTLGLTISTLGLSGLRLRCDIRSAAASMGTPPTVFTRFTYDTGGGPQPVPGIDLTFPADNQFHPWEADLSALTVLEEQETVRLEWAFEDLAASPEPIESFRIDNLELRADKH